MTGQICENRHSDRIKLNLCSLYVSECCKFLMALFERRRPKRQYFLNAYKCLVKSHHPESMDVRESQEGNGWRPVRGVVAE